jgi:hypothetical protein
MIQFIEETTKSAVYVGAVSTLICSSNPRRKSLIVSHNSSGDIYCDRSSGAVMNDGFLLSGHGASFLIDKSDLYTGPVTGITNVSGKQVLVSEGVSRGPARE